MQFILNGLKLVILVISLTLSFSLRSNSQESIKNRNYNNLLEIRMNSQPLGNTPVDNFLRPQTSNPVIDAGESSQENNFSTHETNTVVKVLHLENATENSPANSLGQQLIDSQITQPPYKLKRCDQVVLVKGHRFLDYNDYGNRKPSFFQIGIYVVNIFEGDSTDNLIDSINQEGLSKLPKFIMGTGTCIDIYSDSIGKRYPLCLENTDVMKQIQQVFEDFMRCRSGDDLQGGILKRCRKKATNPILPSLNTKGVSTNSISLINQLGKESDKKINPFYSDRIPGS
jgi:hypothetical protein